MIDRRRFIKTVAGAGVLPFAGPIRAFASRAQDSAGYFNLHPFIENHPEAVFIMKTGVDRMENADAIKAAGTSFARSVIVPADKGVPLTSLIGVKPNIRTGPNWIGKTAAAATVSSDFVGTDVNFVEGVIEGVKELGLGGKQVYIREVNGSASTATKGYPEMAQRTGAELRYMATPVGTISANDLVWVDTPRGVWFRKIPYLWPLNAPGTWTLNIAKMKTHGMGCTLSAKNLQGTIALNYQAHCTSPNTYMTMDRNHMNPNAFGDIQTAFLRHRDGGVPRWDRTGSDWNSGIGMETWAHRCIDNNLASTVGLHIIEAVTGRDGDFSRGPNPQGNDNYQNGNPVSYLMNYIIFGKNSYHCDIIGHWLAGHEPGNMGLFHLALDRGASTLLNPRKIPLYEWKGGQAVLSNLDSFARTPLKTYYLQKNYGGGTEPFWHLVNDPVDYSKFATGVGDHDAERPDAFVLGQNHPNPFNPSTAIEYVLPRDGHVRIEVYNASGQLVEVLADGFRAKGSHMAVWNAWGNASGTYFYRFRCGDFTRTGKMVLLK